MARTGRAGSRMTGFAGWRRAALCRAACVPRALLIIPAAQRQVTPGPAGPAASRLFPQQAGSKA